jgi:hypothetical protein
VLGLIVISAVFLENASAFIDAHESTDRRDHLLREITNRAFGEVSARDDVDLFYTNQL